MDFSVSNRAPPADATGELSLNIQQVLQGKLVKFLANTRFLQLAIGLTFIVFAHMAMTIACRHTEDLAIRGGLKQMDASAIGTEAWMRRSFEGASLALDWMQQRQDTIDSGFGDAKTIERSLSDLVTTHRFDVINAAIIDNDGIARWNVVRGDSPLDLHDRDYFIKQVEHDVGTYISDLKFGRAVHAPAMILSRRLRHPNGSMAGVAVVVLDPVAMSRHLADVVPPPGQRGAVWREGGTLLVLNTWRTAPDVKSELPPEKMVAAIAGHQATTMRKFSRRDGQDVLVAMRRMNDLNLVVSAGIETSSVLGNIARLRQVIWAADAAMLVLMLLAINLDRQRRGRHLAAQAVKNAIERERQFQETQEEVNRIIATFPGAIYRARYQSGEVVTLLYLSRGFTAMTGWPVDQTPDSHNGRAVLTHVLTDIRQQSEARVFPSTQRGVSSERLMECADGSLRHMRFSEHEVSIAEDQTEVIGLITDIEAERLTSANAVVAARLSMLGEMATGLAHEMSQPLTSISLIAENALFALHHDNAPLVQKKLENIPNLIKRATSIIDHLRQFGRQQTAEGTAVPLAQAIEGALLLVGGSLGEASVAVEVKVAKDLEPMWISQVLLEQILVNLLLNARDALMSRPRDQRRVMIAASPLGRFVQITVTDSGPGISPAALSRLFEPFFTTKPVGLGTGLGLSVCHGIVESFGGTIGAENLATGARFTVRLPIASPAQTA